MTGRCERPIDARDSGGAPRRSGRPTRAHPWTSVHNHPPRSRRRPRIGRLRSMSISEAVLEPVPADQEADGPVEVKRGWEQITLALFLALPFLALIAAVPVLWGWGLTWRDVIIAVVMYLVTGHGVT